MVSINIDIKITYADTHGEINPTNWDDDPGHRFLEWITVALSRNDFPINQKGALAHTVAEGLFLVSPAIFKKYDKESWAHTQKRFQKLKLHDKNIDGTNIHTYLVKSKRKNPRPLNGFLVANAEDVLGVELPRPNTFLKRLP